MKNPNYQKTTWTPRRWRLTSGDPDRSPNIEMRLEFVIGAPRLTFLGTGADYLA
jgi:hypothetical protein